MLNISGREFSSHYLYPFKDTEVLLVGAHHPSTGYASEFHGAVFEDLGLLSTE